MLSESAIYSDFSTFFLVLVLCDGVMVHGMNLDISHDQCVALPAQPN